MSTFAQSKRPHEASPTTSAMLSRAHVDQGRKRDFSERLGSAAPSLSGVEPAWNFARVPVTNTSVHFQPKLTISPVDDPLEREADQIAERVMRMPDPANSGTLQRRCTACEPEKEQEKHLSRKATLGSDATLSAPPIVHDVLRQPGRPLDLATRAFFEPRFGFDFSRVRVHSDEQAQRSSAALSAHAYASGSNIAFSAGRYQPDSSAGKWLLAHELAHVVQQSSVIRPYRGKSFNFGVGDEAPLFEESFNVGKDKETKPWIKNVTVVFDASKTDNDGHEFPTGTATAEYYGNPAKWADFTFSVSGRSRSGGKTTNKGTFTVHRIEGIGYNSSLYSGTFEPAADKGAGLQYSKNPNDKPNTANMNFAVFYNSGEALHSGPLDSSSHGCVHVGWHRPTMRQLNYHSVIGSTRVKVSDK